VVSLAFTQVRETHFVTVLLPALSACKSAAGPKTLDLSG